MVNKYINIKAEYEIDEGTLVILNRWGRVELPVFERTTCQRKK